VVLFGVTLVITLLVFRPPLLVIMKRETAMSAQTNAITPLKKQSAAAARPLLPIYVVAILLS